MPYILPSVVSCLFFLLSTGLASGDSTLPLDRFGSGETGRISFPTRDVDGFYDLYRGAKSYRARSVGTLVLPKSATADKNGYCAMVILHGSGGEWSGRGARHAAFLAGNGFAAFVVDTFAGRGIEKEMRYLDRLRQVNVPDQIADAFAALDILSTHPDVNAGCIGVMGYSMGGMAAFLMAFEEVVHASSPNGRHFALHAAFYAPCAFRAEDSKTTGAPIIAFWGEKDQTSDREACGRYVDLLKDGGAAVAVHWLPGAAHGWNGTGEMKFHPTAPRVAPCRFVVGGDGELVERTTWRRARTDSEMIEILGVCSEFGYIIGRHADANETANRLLLDFLDKNLRGKASGRKPIVR